jgi:hypothetical protein
MLVPATTLTNITDSIAALKLEPVTHLKVLIAVFAPLLADPPKPPPRKEAPAMTTRSKGAKRKPGRPHGPALSTVTAMEFLKRELADGPKLASDIDAAALKRNITPNAVGRAKTQLRVVASRANSGHGNAVQIALPSAG